ncbi:MAG: tripartite tricarboxylate transporter permease [Clostridia bacterium]|jgi:putative tricarboxylic transport membrane protein|nr:tripartite tricarboxylate transporter permease [Spirochaetia bacterium]
MIGNILANLLTLQNLLYINIGLAAGIVIGALPGLTATMGVALLLPLTYGLSPITGILLLLGVYCGGIYGGSITAILIKTPGTPASAATILDGYPLARQGRAGQALSMALIASTIAGLFSAMVLLLVAPQLARFALRIGPAEYFALAVFGLTIISSVSGKSIVKGLIMGVLGMLIATIGLDPVGGFDRLTFGFRNLMGGISLIPAMIGLFAISEILEKARTVNLDMEIVGEFQNQKLPKGSILASMKTIIKSSAIGTFIGAVPGTGAAIASFLSYNEAKRSSKTPEKFGTGHLEGVAAAEAGNNGVTGATMIPLLTLGIPGDTVTAIMLGALMLHGITPGPQLFVRQKEWVYAIMLGLLVVNLFMYIQGKFFIKAFINVTKVPVKIMIPALFILCVIGSFAVNNTIFDVGVMLAFGAFAYFLNRLDFPTTPMVIAIILGPMAESNLRRALTISDGNYMTFITRPISALFLAVSVLTFLVPIIKRIVSRKKTA